MQYRQWRREVWPTLSTEKREEITESVRSLRSAGWGITEAWIQAASTI